MWDNCSLTFSHLRSSNPPPPLKITTQVKQDFLLLARLQGVQLKLAPFFASLTTNCVKNYKNLGRGAAPAQQDKYSASKLFSATLSIRRICSRLWLIDNTVKTERRAGLRTNGNGSRTSLPFLRERYPEEGTAKVGGRVSRGAKMKRSWRCECERRCSRSKNG